MARKPLGIEFCNDFQNINDLRTQNYANPQISSADQAGSDGTEVLKYVARNRDVTAGGGC